MKVTPRLIRRTLVIATALLWTAVALPVPHSLNGLGMPLTLALVAVDIMMGILTGWLAFSRSATLDERQSALRDRAFRIAFRLLALGVLFMLVALLVGSITGDYSGGQPQPILGGRWLIALLELLVAMPTAVVAWLQPESVDDTFVEGGPGRRHARWLPLLIVPALATLWLLSFAAMPVRASGIQDDGMHGDMTGASCGHFITTREVSYGFGAQVRLDVQPCWDGQHAFIYPGEQREFLRRCSAVPGSADFANVRLSCAEHTDGNGSLVYTVRATVVSGLVPAVTRAVQLELVVTRDGKASAIG